MLVETRNLTKFYGSFAAVNDLSFSIDRGEIVGLLGPNGAGKTTTMRMLTCYLPPSDGSATVAGFDVMEDALEVRRHIGYMPENNPLYGEMRVDEYLRFRAELKGVPRALRRKRIAESGDLCALGEVRRQIIRTLSKGYRQRVGLADALLSDPDVLVLDEPTIGLDPNQIRQARSTIQALSERHTVLLSTHILQEVEAVCKRVLIIDRGRIVADDTVENLSHTGLRGSVIAEMKGDAEKLKAAILALEGIKEVRAERVNGWNRFTVVPSEDMDVREAVFSLAARNDWPLRELTLSRTSLEDVFHRITVRDETSGDGH